MEANGALIGHGLDINRDLQYMHRKIPKIMLEEMSLAGLLNVLFVLRGSYGTPSGVECIE